MDHLNERTAAKHLAKEAKKKKKAKEPSDFATFLWQSQELFAQYIANIYM